MGAPPSLKVIVPRFPGVGATAAAKVINLPPVVAVLGVAVRIVAVLTAAGTIVYVWPVKLPLPVAQEHAHVAAA